MSTLAKILLDAALGYTEASPQWPVFPVHPTEKRPLLKTGEDHAVNSSTDPATITRWFTRDYPGCRLGVPTGWPSGTIVIDVDPKDDGAARLAELESALGPLPRVRVAQTKSVGQHLYFARPVTPFRIPSGAGPKSALGLLLCERGGVDVRADGGFVVVPPSPGYTWIADDDELLPELPLVWLAAICGMGKPPIVARPFVSSHHASDDDKVRRARAYLAKIPGAVSEAGGHTQTFNAVAAVMIGFDLDEATAGALLDEYNQRCDPPWKPRELEHKIRSAAKRCKRPRGYLLAEVR